MSDPSAPPAPAGTEGAVLGRLKFHETNFFEPFRRVNIPPSHRFGPEFNQPTDLAASRIDGRGYDCGCRAIKDYDRKIGNKIAEDIAGVFEKLFPIYGAFKLVQSGLSALAKNIPGIGAKIAELIDDADPIIALLKFVAGGVDAMLVENLFRSVPAWVPVLRNAPVARDFHEQEVEGFLVRSHQRHDGVPYSQWHLWYDWSFLVSPVGSTFDMVGDGNRRRDEGADSGVDQLQLDSRRYERHWMPPAANINFSLQCEWDLGAIGERPLPDASQASDSSGGAFFNTGPLKRDWGWPMAGHYFWAGGRSVYDCRASTSDDRTKGLHLNQLRPLKAMATARWEGFKFEENRAAVSAIQFVFFASNAKLSGGDFKFPSLSDVDYEFVVQLPPGGSGVPSDDPYPVGALPRFRLNTIDVGRRLLVHTTSEPFFDGVHHPSRGAGLKPIVTPVFTGRTRAPTHAHVRIPLRQLPSQFDNYGVVVTLGWHDPAGVLAAEVFEVTVAFRELEIHDAKEGGTAEWEVNFGVNGRWFQRRFEFPVAGDLSRQPVRVPIRNATVTLFLSERDQLSVACHGLEEDGEGDQFKLPIDASDPEKPPPGAPKSEFDRWIKEHLNTKALRLSDGVDLPVAVEGGQVKTEHVELPFVGKVVDWTGDMDTLRLGQSKEQRDKVNATASEVARALFVRTSTYAFDANDPLGIVDPNIFDRKQQFGRRNDAIDTPNPQEMRELLERVGPGGSRKARHTGYALVRMGRMGTLGYDEKPREFKDDDPGERHDVRVDYVLHYDVTIRAQGGRASPGPAPSGPTPPAPGVAGPA